MNKMKRIQIQTKIEKIFSELGIQYKRLDLDDEDLNYELKITTEGDLKPLNYIHCISYLDFDRNTINTIIPNIYSVSNEDNITRLYETMNKVNMKTLTGVFNLFQSDDREKKQIIFRSTINCGENFSEIDTTFNKDYIFSLIFSLSYFFKELLKVTDDGI